MNSFDSFCQNFVCFLSQGLGKQRILRFAAVGYSPGAGIGAGGDETAHGAEVGHILKGALQNGADGALVKAAFTPQVAYGGKGGHPDSAVFC